jgi:hypothetical protein
MNRKCAYLLLICFFLYFPEIVFHHHKDGIPHDNCSICSFVSHNSVLAPQSSAQILLISSNVLFISIENADNISNLFYHPYSNRAPPA